GVVAPGIVETVAAVGRQRRIDAQAPRGFGKNADLVAGGGGEQQEALGHCLYCRASVQCARHECFVASCAGSTITLARKTLQRTFRTLPRRGAPPKRNA